MSMNGVDASAFQPHNLFDLIDADFGLVKATEGTDYVSAACDPQVQSLIKKRKPFGVYHFAHGGNVAEEADYFLAHTGGYHTHGLLVLDFEGDALKAGASWALQFLNRVKEKTGVTPVIYGSRGNLCTGSYAPVAQAGYPLWVAAYPFPKATGFGSHSPGSVAPWSSSIIYQYTDEGRVRGYDGALDLDIAYITASQWSVLAARGGKAPAPAPAAPAPRPVLKEGDRGDEVGELQDLLNKHGAKPQLKVDKVFGTATGNALFDFQAAEHITADRICGPATWGKLL